MNKNFEPIPDEYEKTIHNPTYLQILTQQAILRSRHGILGFYSKGLDIDNHCHISSNTLKIRLEPIMLPIFLDVENNKSTCLRTFPPCVVDTAGKSLI
jgi:hypothetical protein